MSDYDDDNIEFDFFEEPAQEPEPKRGLQRRPRRPDGPTRPPVRPGAGLIPLLRLLGLIAAAIAVVLLVVEIGGCSSTSSAYKSYLSHAKPIADQSAAQGTQLTTMLAQGSLNEKTVERTLGGLVTSADKLQQQAQALDPPGALRDEHEDLLDALRLRRLALAGLLDIFKTTRSQKKNAGIGKNFADETNRFAASDVVWRDLFKLRAADALEQHGVRGVEPPASVFLRSSLDAKSLENLWKRVHGSATNANVLRGTALEGVKFQPGCSPGETCSPAIPLSPDANTDLRESVGMKFVVSVKDTGDVQETNVKVRVVIGQSDPLTGVIPLMNPGDVKNVELTITGTPILDVPTKVDVTVTPVPHEAKLSNNTHQYTVTFHV